MIIKGVITAAAVFLGWLTVLAGVTLTGDRAPAALVIMPSEVFLSSLPADAAIVARGPLSITLAGSEAKFAWRLYEAGALLVLPAGLQGCAPLATSPLSTTKGHIVSTAPP